MKEGNSSLVGFCKELAFEHRAASVWRTLYPDFPVANIHIPNRSALAVDYVRELEQKNQDEDVQVLVAGSSKVIVRVAEAAGLKQALLHGYREYTGPNR